MLPVMSDSETGPARLHLSVRQDTKAFFLEQDFARLDCFRFLYISLFTPGQLLSV